MGTDQFRCQLTVRRRNRDDGATGHPCGSTTFVYVDMGGLGAQVIDAGALGAALALRTGIVQFNSRTVG